MRRLRYLFASVILTVSFMGQLALPRLTAADDNGFSLQVTPSPLVATLKPGQNTEVDLKVRNEGTATEKLKIESRSFTSNDTATAVTLGETPPREISDWVSYSNPTFSVDPGQWFTEKIHFNIPSATGFSYSFAFVISRQSEQKPTSGGRLIKGSVAVFSLINIDRPGATRQLNLAQFSADRHFYEYLPATFTVHLKNSGNTIVQPAGNVFIQRGSNSTSPLGTLNVNSNKGYVLPGTSRTFTAEWSDGLPVYQTVTKADGTKHRVLKWNVGNAKFSSIRIGRYTAKLVAVYTDSNGHDVPIEGTVSFWVIPWKILLVLLLLALIVIGFITIVSVWFWRRHKRKRQAKKQKLDKKADDEA